MGIHRNIPVDMLPEELREGMADGSRATVIIETREEPIPGYSATELNALLAECGKGEPLRFETREDFRAYMRDKVERAIARRKKTA